ncbi:MAG: single-stranded DNA-binding protein [Cyanobacteria bacterium SZAS TMP-1]|nr:single-stranded DNA-binding protein [Cyanobacteria bacterium SZAS TMP-1]
MINNLTLVGRIGADPETRYFENGTMKASLRMAVTRPDKNKTTDWFDLEAWGKHVEIIEQYVKKGHLLGVTGSIQQSTWTDKDSGEKRSKVIVHVNNIRLMQPKNSGGSSEEAGNDFDWDS